MLPSVYSPGNPRIFPHVLLIQSLSVLYSRGRRFSSPPVLRWSFVSTFGGCGGFPVTLEIMLKVNLPDGSVWNILVAFDRSTSPPTSARGWPRRLWPPKWTAGWWAPTSRCPPTARSPCACSRTKTPRPWTCMRHSCAHVMARAVMRLFDGVQLAFGPTVANGFYYDFQLEHAALRGRLPQDRGRDGQDRQGGRAVRAGRDGPRTRPSSSAATCGQSLKVEHLEDGLADEATVSFYRQGEFLDLCRGPHVPSAGAIGAFKLLSVAGAYWKGDASRQQLQRLYGTALFSKQDLDDHLQQVEEAKRRDHRVLGKQLELFMIDPDGRLGPGLLAAQGGDHPPRVGELPLRRTDPPRLPAGLHAGHRQRAVVRDLGPLSVLQGRRSSRRSRWPTASATC